MVIFNQLKIGDNGSKMYINATVNQAGYLSAVSAESITILTADKVSETNSNVPSDANTEVKYIYHKEFDEGTTEIDMVLDKAAFDAAFNHMSEDGATATEPFNHSNLSQDLFFVYIKVTEGTPDPCAPCGTDNPITLGVVFDEKVLYQKVMSFTKELAQDCQIPTAFIDFILQWNALKACIETGHSIEAIKFWNLLFDNVNSAGSQSKGCGCHG